MPIVQPPEPDPNTVFTGGNSSAEASKSLRRRLKQVREPYVLLPVIAILVLLTIWLAVLHLIQVERIAAEHTIAAASLEMGETYEAQIVRALHEIDQTLKFIKYTYEVKAEHNPLPELDERTLLPPDFLFAVGIVDVHGAVVASTRVLKAQNFSGQDDFETLRHSDMLAISHAWRSAETGEWKLRFSRRLNSTDGLFAGVAIIEAEAAYFTSGYESSKIGTHGLLGLLGTDGVFRVRRTGESVFAGDVVDYTALVPDITSDDAKAILSVNKWDNEQRYISARQLYDFPLAVIVGLSRNEQLTPIVSRAHDYKIRATLGSVVVVVLFGMLTRMSWQLSQGRLRAAKVKLAYAKQVEYLAYHDGLTALPNRSLFSKLLEQSINQAQRNHRQLAVLFLDLDRFKLINDTLGHDAGDNLLREIATRLQSCLRGSDTVARLGGDEFVVLLPELDEEKYAAIVAQKILASVAKPINLLGKEYCVTASIGVATYPQDGLDEQVSTSPKLRQR